MKKALIASTALVLTAGVAAADVTISGYGRTGVIYTEDQAGNESQIISRLRMNIDAATSSDQGVDFGARFRIQWDQNSDDAGKLNAGKLWVTSQGLTVEIGNVDTAFDSAALLYGSELGSYDRDLVRRGSFFAYDADEYANGDGRTDDYVGIAVKYTIADVNLIASYVDPDQSGLTDDDEEFGLAASYTWNDRLELSAAAVMDGEGVAENDIYFVGARYAVMPNARVGLNYLDADNDSAEDAGKTFTLYGDYTLADGLTNIEAYVANNDLAGNDTDNAFGIGVNYDLGGARLGASIHRGYDERVTADMGVRFDF
ncbi:porin [Paracoccus spongiarum]|uniref:Porin n=1 Tax=Paracoccus spongiarum TaxID=3064387 RepID=A0ABT9JF86_9RHOB|nr:porin [Paracoccus sp. 2205BS29-5]MDP5308488.1 porin [Paracoccus sp. 2205BS29-5]